jgi:hypothetical protein
MIRKYNNLRKSVTVFALFFVLVFVFPNVAEPGENGESGSYPDIIVPSYSSAAFGSGSTFSYRSFVHSSASYSASIFSPWRPVILTPKIYVLVESTIYPNIVAHVDRYMEDLKNEGNYYPVLFTDGWVDEVEVKNLLIDGYNDNMVGALFVGDIPVAWYEMVDPYMSSGWAAFPFDLYYMDLDGFWYDNDQNGLYDGHLAAGGDLEPEIFIGRLYASSLDIPGETEVTLIQNYFDKNHAYRTQNMQLNKRALVYVDDDWYTSADGWGSDVGILYDDRVLVKEKDDTTATDYKTRLRENYEWISLFAHSNPAQHCFMSSSGPETVSTWDIDPIDPIANFYNLYCCSAGNYTYTQNYGCLAGHYVFSKSYGLCAVTSTKVGGMYYFEEFYEPLSYGSCIGKAFMLWFEKHGESARVMFYGMTIIGDLTLVPNMP